MEIDVTELDWPARRLWIGAAIAGLVLLLGLLGWWLTPQGQLLTWNEWQVFQEHLAYQSGLRLLARHADRLAELLAAPPDPVRAELAAEQLIGDLEQRDLAALSVPKAALLAAAEAVRQWALGVGTRDAAVASLAAANTAIQRAAALGQE